MEFHPSLTHYFNETDLPHSAAQFFDEIGTSPSTEVNKEVLSDCGVDEEPAAKLILPSKPPTQSKPQGNSSEGAEVQFLSLNQTVNGSTAATTNDLPDPATFFDNIGSESAGSNSTSALTEAMDGLSLKNQPVDHEAIRRRDAWIPMEEARKTLEKIKSSPQGSFFPERELLTMPGLVLDEELTDSLQEITVKHLGVSSAGSRGVLRAEHVTKDEHGLRELIRTGHFRAAINLTGVLITAAGQGVGRMNRQTKHTPRTLQLWLCRFALLMKIKKNDILIKEAEPFGDLNNADMFFGFYPETYGDRGGSMAPFSLRLMLAELPSHVGRPEESIDRLYALQDVMRRMIFHLTRGKTEDGTGTITEQDKAESLRLWMGREMRVQHSMVNCAITLRDYRLAASILANIQRQAGSHTLRRAMASALCRLWLLAGHVKAATAQFEAARRIRHQFCPTPDVREYVDLGLIEIANGRYEDAYNTFVKAADQEPTNIMVANNIAVCFLYIGRLKEAIAVLQKVVDADPERALTDNLLINLCTLHELESSQTKDKKMHLLRLMCRHKSDTSPDAEQSLKLG